MSGTRKDGGEGAMLEVLNGCDGLFVGLLSEAEVEALNYLSAKGLAQRSYESAGGFMGLAKVRILRERQP